MKGSNKHCKWGQLAMAVHYAAFMKSKRRCYDNEIQDILG
jgi:hypothetical protein